ncbi:MAG: trypsin-like peptidase domain-containing protein [Acidobacteria bacterium]|nr:trypsin-like peptidase domain-containing protein [Acidobacteriota bacterium]
MSRKLTATILSVFLLVYSGTGFWVANAEGADGADLAQPSAKTETALAHLSSSLEALSQRIGPAVVQIFTTGYRPVSGGANSGLLSKRRSGGSGVILDREGYIVTNAHVVEGAQRVQVLLTVSLPSVPERASILKPRGKMVEAQIVGIDRETDLAVLKIPERDLPFVELGDSDEVKQGQLVLAFGSPLGLENSVTLGVVSSVARQLRPEDPVVYIQTDAPINPGNSGGPLINANGKAVGINTFILSQSGGNEGLGFAVPSNIVKYVFKQIRKTGRVGRGQIGVHPQTVTPTLAAGLGLSQEWGVVLGDVFPWGPANMAGLKVGDLILSLDGKVMENGRQFDVNLYRRAGDMVTVELLRGSQKLFFRVPVVERKDGFASLAGMVTPDNNLVPELGILGLDIDSKIAKVLSPPRKLGGVLVAARSVDSPYWQEAFLPGDVIYAINEKAVTSLAGLRVIVSHLKTGDPVVAQVQRRGTLGFIAFEID